MSKKDEVTTSDKCGHINKQFVNIDGQLEDLKCELPDGHDGDHKATYQCLRILDGMKNPALHYVVRNGREYLLTEEQAFWTDAAGKTIFEYQAEMEDKRRQLEEFKLANPGRNEEHRQKARDLGLLPINRA